MGLWANFLSMCCAVGFRYLLEALHCSSKILLFWLKGNNDGNTCPSRRIKHFIKKTKKDTTKEAIII
jgi:hypothetical protein